MKPSRCRGFTLLELLIVVAVVTILTWLALFVIGRVRDHAALSTLRNNLRQVYQAKEYYFAETGSTQPTSVIVLAREGYISQSFRDRLMNGHSFEAALGWRYERSFRVNEPVSATKGTGNAAVTIYYPGPASMAVPTAPVVMSTTTGTPVVPGDAAQPNPAVSTTQPPILPATQVPSVTTSSGPEVVPAQTGGNPPANAVAPHGPGNSDFGHSHHQGHGNSPKH